MSMFEDFTNRHIFLALLIVLCSNREVQAANCNEDDVEYWRFGGGFYASVDSWQKCGSTTAGDPQQVETCVDAEFEAYSQDCQVCMEDIIICTATFCVSDCFLSLSGIRQQPCIECVEINCNPAFEVCAGFPADTCEGCVDPNAPIDIVPIIAATCSIAGVLGISALCYVFYKRQKAIADHEEHALEQLGVLPIAKIVAKNSMEQKTDVRNPIESIDFDGDQTELARMDDGTSEIIPGDINSDLNSEFTKPPEF